MGFFFLPIRTFSVFKEVSDADRDITRSRLNATSSESAREELHVAYVLKRSLTSVLPTINLLSDINRRKSEHTEKRSSCTCFYLLHVELGKCQLHVSSCGIMEMFESVKRLLNLFFTERAS